MKKKMVVVGAGISGLCTGFYAQLNGFDTEIHEMHSIPGGLCTSWTRKGYTFDTSMHFLMSSRKGPFKKLWDELGITTNHEFHYHDRVAFIEGEGKKIDFCVDRKKLEDQMRAISPVDSELIKEFTDIFFDDSPLANMSLDAPEVTGIIGKVKMLSAMLPMMKKYRKYAGVTLQDFAARFKDPFLSKAVRYQMDAPGWPMPKWPFMFLAGGAEAVSLNSGYPLGGSKNVVFGIAKRFEELGGKIHYKSSVKDIIIEKGKVTGIQLDDGSIHTADIVVWCADGHRLHFDILKEKHMDKMVRKMYEEWLPVNPLVQVMFGVDMDLSGGPHALVMEVDKPIRVGDKENKWIQIMSHCFDKSTAPPGKSAIEVWYSTDYQYWENLIKDREKYDSEKKRIADETADALEAKWPGFRSKIEMIDVPTPITYKRYTGNWLGSPDGWHLTVDNYRNQAMKKTVPGLENLYTVSQWGAPFTGTVSTSLGGRQLVQILCKKNKIPFRSTAA